MPVTYEAALAEAKARGVGRCSDAAAMAVFCQGTIQQLVGAVSPKLVWEGAVTSGLTGLDLARLCQTSPGSVEDLMWL